MGVDPAALHGQPLIIGAGAAGMMTALMLAPRPCVLVSAGAPGALAASAMAQGGLAASLADDDCVDLHLTDTLAAGAGLCEAPAARRILAAAPAAIDRLAALGARFDRDAAGRLALGLEAAHSRRRIVHAGGDGSGAEITRALAAAVRAAPHVTLLEGARATDILLHDGAVAGVRLAMAQGEARVATPAVVLATGGVGGLYACTTNPLAARGAGLALAERAGATIADAEFVQFHPTALAIGAGSGPLPLISEAVRGEGALLLNERGERFMLDTPGAELAPRDVVARAIWREQQKGRRVFLDARECLGARFATRFPAVAALCAAHGFDAARDLLPVTPAAHYHMGGVAVDGAGRSTVAGLWACGEAARTGLHGANRLASNSLIEAVACAGFVAADINGGHQPPPRRFGAAFAASPAPSQPAETEAPPESLATIRAVMWRCVGLERTRSGLNAAIDALTPIANDAAGPDRDAARTALLIVEAALRRSDSLGAHFRLDAEPDADAKPVLDTRAPDGRSRRRITREARTSPLSQSPALARTAS